MTDEGWVHNDGSVGGKNILCSNASETSASNLPKVVQLAFTYPDTHQICFSSLTHLTLEALCDIIGLHPMSCLAS